MERLLISQKANDTIAELRKTRKKSPTTTLRVRRLIWLVALVRTARNGLRAYAVVTESPVNVAKAMSIPIVGFPRHIESADS
jgi:hypothetical protein